jgi:tetratricopeptide (TPR) repeat protein
VSEEQTNEQVYTEEELKQIRECLLTWKRIQDMPARPFWHLIIDDLDAVELAAAADRYESAGSGQLAILALEKLVAIPEKNPYVNYQDALTDLVTYHRETGHYDRAIAYQQQLVNMSATEEGLNTEQETNYLNEIQQESQAPDHSQWLLENEPTLMGRYLNVSHELALKTLGSLTEPRTSRPGATIDWYDYLEEIHVHLNHRMCSWATASSLLITGETMFVEGLLWTVLTRPAEVVQQELSDFTRAFAAVRLRRAATIDPSIQQSYETFVQMLTRTQETADTYRAIFERYFTGNYDMNERPEASLYKAERLIDASPLMVRTQIAEAGARLLREDNAFVTQFFQSIPPNRKTEMYPLGWTGRVVTRNNLLPMDEAKAERALWQPYVSGEVSLQQPLGVPDLKALGQKVHPERKDNQPKAVENKPVIANPPSTTRPQENSRPVKVGRNEPCPCGSGKKYKRCCGQ